MKTGQGPRQVAFPFGPYLKTIFLLALALQFLAFAQAPPQPHAPAVAMMAVPRVTVPDVRGRPLAEAQEILERAGLQPGKTSSSAGPGIVGTVMQQEPLQNSVALRGTTFHLIYVAASKGQNTGNSGENFTRQVPSLIGLSQNAASNLLERSHLQLGSVIQGTGRGAPGTIFEQKPPQATWVKEWSKIDVAIVQSSASAPKPPTYTEPPVWVFVPNLLGQTQNEAAEVLLKYGLRLGEVSSGLASVPAGSVFAQAPLSGVRVLQGTSIRIRIAEAPPRTTVIVPDLSHAAIGSARTLLAQAGLQLGDSSVEEGDAPPDSIIAQSPQAGTTVERGSSVNVVVAQPVPPVEVPNLVNREEAEAVSLLSQAGLQMGTIRERQDPASSGTVLSQSPQPHELVRKGNPVDVVVSRQVQSQLSVLLDRANPGKGQMLTFRAELEPAQTGASYRFDFGDGQSSNWQPATEVVHTYNSSGKFSVQAFARGREASLQSEPVTVSIPGVSPGIIAGLSAATLVLAFGGFVLYGRNLFHKWIRVMPALDSGTQRISMDTAAGWGQAVQVCIHQDPGVQFIQWSGKDAPRKADLR